MTQRKVLVVDDEESLRTLLGIMLRKEGFDVVLADSRGQAAKVLERGEVDVVITDVRLPDGDGIEILRHVKSASPDTVVIVMTAFGSTESAVGAMKLGAHDYLIKPFDLEELKIVVQSALERQHLRQENRRLKAEFESQHGLATIIGRSPAMARLFDTVRAVASTGSTILLTGESGTGKEVIAKAIHAISPRKDAAFVSINCAALPETLFESELFGHVKGAFTDAHQNKKGLFEVAHKGTILLDEVGETPLSVQVKLLRALQERRIRRVGGTDEIEVDVRVIGATNRVLEEMVKTRRFREDLYYRLNVIPIRVPPLRERPEDVPLLVEHFNRQFSERLGRAPQALSRSALDRLSREPWPGNVRQLENVIERALALGVSPEVLVEVEPSGVPAPSSSGSGQTSVGEGFNLDAYLRAEEGRLLREALKRSGGDRSTACRLLGLNARGLRYLISKHALADNS